MFIMHASHLCWKLGTIFTHSSPTPGLYKQVINKYTYMSVTIQIGYIKLICVGLSQIALPSSIIDHKYSKVKLCVKVGSCPYDLLHTVYVVSPIC